MLTASDEVVLTALYKQPISMCKESNISALILVKLLDLKDHWVPYLTDQVKGNSDYVDHPFLSLIILVC